MEKKLIALFLIALIGGLGGGYGLSYTIYEPHLSRLQTSYDSLNTTLQFNVSSLQSDISNLQSQLTDLNITYAELQENYTELLSKYQQLEALLYGLPEFSIVDASYEAVKYLGGGGYTLGGIVYVTVQNIGDGDAHNVTVYSEVELYPMTDPLTGEENVTYTWYGNVSAHLLVSKEVRKLSIRLNQPWSSNLIRLHILYLNVTCVEGVTQGVTFEDPFLITEPLTFWITSSYSAGI